jgi:hypothetical protein
MLNGFTVMGQSHHAEVQNVPSYIEQSLLHAYKMHIHAMHMHTKCNVVFLITYAAKSESESELNLLHTLH